MTPKFKAKAKAKTAENKQRKIIIGIAFTLNIIAMIILGINQGNHNGTIGEITTVYHAP